MAITIRDIAKRANVSIATVSRVLNNSSKVSKETKDKIHRVMEELNYKPNALARGLIKRSLRTVGVLIQDMNNIFYPAVIKGIEDELEIHDYNIFLCNTDSNLDKEKKYIDTLVGKGVDGIIFMGTRPVGMKHNEHIAALCKKIPVLIINDDIIGVDVYSVATNEVNGAYKAISYFIELDHRKIAFINGNTDYTTYRYKFEGYKRAILDNGIDLNPDYIIQEEPYEKGGYKGAKKLLSLKNRPTAIFSASDQIAIGIIRAVFEAGYSIPDDFSIIGFSGVPISAEIFPQLTTVNQFPFKTGKIAASLIIKAINKQQLEQRKILIEPELSIRKTCRKL